MVAPKDDPDDVARQFKKFVQAGAKRVKSPRQAKLTLLLAAPAQALIRYTQMLREVATEFGLDLQAVARCCSDLGKHMVDHMTDPETTATKSVADALADMRKIIDGFYSIVETAFPDPPDGKDADGEEEKEA